MPRFGKVVIYGSLAYDRVMDFPGRFKDNFLPSKLHAINVSFAVPTLKEGWGGTSGNICYNLGLLKLKSIVLGSVGNDFSKYSKWLKSHSVNIKYVSTVKNLSTASAYIITDKDDNQITGFYYGAMQIPYTRFDRSLLKNSLVIIAPGHTRDMEKLVYTCVLTRTKFIYDPGQQITSIKPGELKLGVMNSEVFIGNDYEVSLVAKKLGLSEKALISKCKILIRTLGAKGSEIWQNGRSLKIKAVRPKKVVDPTGAGDAYRAGIIYGLIKGWPLRKSGELASKISAKAVEKYGTQNHEFNL